MPPRTAAAGACPCGRPLTAHPLQEALRHLQEGLARAPVGPLLLFLGPGAHRVCLCPPEWSLCFAQSCGSPVIKSHWPSQSGSLGIPSLLPGPWAGKPDVGPRVFTAITDLQCGCPPGRCEICFYCGYTPILLWLLLCPWKRRVFFFWWVPVSSC